MSGAVNDEKPNDDPVIGGVPVPDEIGGVPDDAGYENLAGALPPKSKQKRSPSSPRWPFYVAAGCMVMCCLCCVLPLCGLSATGAGFAAIMSNSEATETQTTTVTLETDNIFLTVDNSVGEINIQPGSSDEVVVEYTKKAYGLTKGQAENELDNIQVEVTQPSAEEVMITVNTDRKNDSFFSFANQVKMTILVPDDLRLDVRSNTGSIQVRDVFARSLYLKTNTGEIAFEGGLTSDSTARLELETNTGSIDVRLPLDSYVQLDANSDVGDVSVSDRFALSDVSSNRDGPGESWSGVLGSGEGNPPRLRLRTNTGSIDVEISRGTP